MHWFFFLSPCRPRGIVLPPLRPQMLDSGRGNQSSGHAPLAQEPAALRTQEMPQPGLQVSVCAWKKKRRRRRKKTAIVNLYSLPFLSSPSARTASSTRWTLWSSRAPPSPMPALDTCWTTAWWRATVPHGGRRRAPPCPAASRSVNAFKGENKKIKSCGSDSLTSRRLVTFARREQWRLGAQRGGFLAGVREVSTLALCFFFPLHKEI